MTLGLGIAAAILFLTVWLYKDDLNGFKYYLQVTINQEVIMDSYWTTDTSYDIPIEYEYVDSEV